MSFMELNNNVHKQPIVIAPFLKWAGGKRWLVDRHADVFPEFEGRYFEPFLGGGSVFFHLSPNASVLSDMNTHLIECYQQIRDDHETVVKLLEEHQKNFNKNYYYEIRSTKFIDKNERAAQFLFLNRTCWNGLYRVNLKGEFNVPIGTKSTVVFKHDDFAAVAARLKNTTLVQCDFEDTIDVASEGDFVFVDPPYTVKHNFNGFLKYNERIFSWEDQIRLKNSIVRATNRGVKILISNAAHASVRELYSELGKMIELERGSVLAGKKEARGIVQEILVSI